MQIAIIPARSGSKRIPAKNVRLFYGKPIMAYSIATAQASRLFDAIVVSTDSQDYAALAKAYGAKVHMRAHHLADDMTGTQAVARAALIWWRAVQPEARVERACCIYATSPLMRAEDLKRGLAALERPGIRFAHSVGEDGQDAAQFYWGDERAFVDEVPLDVRNRGPHVYPVDIDRRRVCDINTEDDWQRAERMYQELQTEESREP